MPPSAKIADGGSSQALFVAFDLTFDFCVFDLLFDQVASPPFLDAPVSKDR